MSRSHLRYAAAKLRRVGPGFAVALVASLALRRCAVLQPATTNFGHWLMRTGAEVRLDHTRGRLALWLLRDWCGIACCGTSRANVCTLIVSHLVLSLTRQAGQQRQPGCVGRCRRRCRRICIQAVSSTASATMPHQI